MNEASIKFSKFFKDIKDTIFSDKYYNNYTNYLNKLNDLFGTKNKYLKDALKLSYQPITNIMSIYHDYASSSNNIFNLLNCKFIGDNLIILMDILHTSLGVYLNSFGVVTCLLNLFIFIGIVFDMIGVAALTSKKENFHAMASKKLKGAKEAITMLNHSNMVATVCNDVVGDICGIVSGGFGAVLAISIADKTEISVVLSTIIVTALISALTVGGKSLGKNIAIKNSDKIIYRVAKIKKMLSIK